jgi:plastocyanin
MGHLVRGPVRIGLVMLATAVAVAVLPLVTARVLSRPSDNLREIHISVRDMSYYVEGSPDPNPTLRVEAGQRVRIVLSNNDVGMSHDLQIPGWSVGTRLLKGKGTDTLDFRAPTERGKSSYKCTPHSEMMQGTIEVE